MRQVSLIIIFILQLWKLSYLLKVCSEFGFGWIKVVLIYVQLVRGGKEVVIFFLGFFCGFVVLFFIFYEQEGVVMLFWLEYYNFYLLGRVVLSVFVYLVLCIIYINWMGFCLIFLSFQVELLQQCYLLFMSWGSVFFLQQFYFFVYRV